MHRTLLHALLVGDLCAVLAAPAVAQHHEHGDRGGERHDFGDHGGERHDFGDRGGERHDFGDRGGERHDFGGRDYRHFTPSERHTWEGGHWVHGWHDGHFGWWWGTDLGWFPYPQPVYPYPTYIAPPIAAGPPGIWYYCDDPPGYYPYVPNCRLQWRQVPATPGG